jgi:ferric-dicitrate binding protein FerR (iron transport regulator)
MTTMPDLIEPIWEIITKSISEKLNREEQNLLNTWLNQDNNEAIYNCFKESRFSAIVEQSQIQKETIFEDISKRIERKKAQVRKLSILSAAAAVLLLLIGSSLVFYKLGEKKFNNQLIEIYTPKGTRSQIKLSDGSLIVMNADSRLIYPARFYGANREVKFEGEGFFSISKDKSHPFIVKTSSVKVKVLGTRFNLKSYRNDNIIETSLEEGLVNVSSLINPERSILIKPGNKAIFNNESKLFKVDNANVKLISSWQEGRYYFKSESFEEIAKEMERCFNITIDIKSEKLKKEVFTGDFIRGENIDQILAIIKKSTGINYRIVGQYIEIIE